MAIKINNLQQISDQYEVANFVYQDLHLDFKTNGSYSQVFAKADEGNDIKVDYDESAIRNSLRNLFNTRPGQRFLFPEYGLDLYQFVFEPISENNAQLIGERIVRSIELYEPRVILRECKIEAVPDDNVYEITIIVQFPVFNTLASLNSKLDIRNQSFVFVETSRNR